ncbi:YHYH protein [uncultured Croceitalea sp.]|uniref:YHYH protein n=1 Tax=uncultured Croceitalea sp. TaxID=1798908 RepID=UPI0033062D17
MIKRFKSLPILLPVILFASIGFVACSSDNNTDFPLNEEGNDDDDEIVTELHAAFTAFNEEATTIFLDGSEVVIETTGLPNHETVYWGEDNALYRDEPDVRLTPTRIPDRDQAQTIMVDASPNLTGSSVATELGIIGVAVSGSYIFNDQEGNGTLDQAAGSLDWTGAHIGPSVYHYHLEPKAFTDDDDELAGILLDGVFLYGRKCNAIADYPTDLDSSGGHTSTTQYSDGEEEYHYHIINEIYSTTGSYIAFAGPFQGY